MGNRTKRMKVQIGRRVCSVALTLLMVLSLFPANAVYHPVKAATTDGAGTDSTTPPDGYQTDKNKIMAFRINSSSIDIQGYVAGSWRRVTCGNGGFQPYYRKNGSTSEISVSGLSAGGSVSVYDGKLTMTPSVQFSGDGQLLYMGYVVKNDTDSDVTGFELGIVADTMINNNDSSKNEKLVLDETVGGIGFVMTDISNSVTIDGKPSHVSFVLACKGVGEVDADEYWYGAFGNHKPFNKTADSVDTTGDSALAYSWLNQTIPAHGSKSFIVVCGIGDVTDLKAALSKLSANLDYASDEISGLTSGADFKVMITSAGEDNGKEYIIKADADGRLPLCGKDTDNQPYDLTGKSFEIEQWNTTSNTAVSDKQEITIPARPATPDKPAIGDSSMTAAETPAAAKRDNILFDGDTMTITDTTEGLVYAVVPAGGDIKSAQWIVPNEDGTVRFSELAGDTDYVIYAKVPETEEKPASFPSAGVTIAAAERSAYASVTAADYIGVYDGQAHNITVTADDAAILYATSYNGAFTSTEPEFVNVCEAQTIYYCVTREDCYPVYGSKTVSISPKTITIDNVMLDSETQTYAFTGDAVTPNVLVKDGNVRLIRDEDFTVANDTETDMGAYALTVTGTGNYTGTIEVPWKITDQNPPTGKISIQGREYTSFADSPAFTLFCKPAEQAALTGADLAGESGLDKCYYYISDFRLTKAEVAALAASKWTETAAGGISLKPNQNQIIYGKITDKSGNVTYICSDGIVCDGKRPDIALFDKEQKQTSGYLKNGAKQTFCETTALQITDANMDTVTVNGKAVLLAEDDIYTLQPSGTAYVVTATDKAGNSSTVTLTVNAGHTWGAWETLRQADAGSAGLKCHTCTVCGVKAFEKIPASGTPEDTVSDNYKGDVEKAVEITPAETKPGEPETPSIPAAEMGNKKQELVDKLLTRTEKTAVENGDSVRIWMTVDNLTGDTVPQDDKNKIENAVKLFMQLGDADKLPPITYFDVSLYKKVGDAEKERIHESKVAISVSVTLPEALLTQDAKAVRTYNVVRMHNGMVTILSGAFDKKTGELTFLSDKFSTYAIFYQDASHTAHSYGAWEDAGDGSQHKRCCPVCEDVETEAHKWNKGVVTREATKTAEGEKVYTCTVCKAERKESIPKLDEEEADTPTEDTQTKKELTILLARGAEKSKDSITLTWLKEDGAAGYEVYWSYCDGKQKYKKLATVKAGKPRTYTHKKLKKNREYKYYIKSYKKVKGKKVYISKSPAIHVAMNSDKKTNAASIKLRKTKVTLSLQKGKTKTFQIIATAKRQNPNKQLLDHAKPLRYYTSDKSIAKVSAKGVITAKGKGKCTIYIIANNGVYNKVRVTVQ